jgi:hypothetical protein
MTAPVTIHHEARLVPFADGAEYAAVQPGSWFITFGFGKPAQNTYTEVVLAPAVRDAGHPEHVLDEAVRAVARDLYGTAYAFTYRPEQYADAIEKYGVKRRERVAITELEVWE